MKANTISCVSTIAARSMAGVLGDRGVRGRNVIGHDIREFGAVVEQDGGGSTGETNGTVRAGDIVLLRPREAECAASV
jgi:hypothetical protein